MDTPTLSWCKAVACSKFKPGEYTLKLVAPLVHRCRSGSRTPPCSGRRRPACRHWPGSAHRLGHRLQTRSRQLATRPPETGLTMAMAFLQRSFRLFRRRLLRHAPGAVPCSCALYGIRGNSWGANRSACRQKRLAYPKPNVRQEAVVEEHMLGYRCVKVSIDGAIPRARRARRPRESERTLRSGGAGISWSENDCSGRNLASA